MRKQPSSPLTRLTRREVIQLGAGAGLGMVSALGGIGQARPAAQGRPSASSGPTATRRKYPPIPSWKTELKQLAPNVFAYIQGGGPGVDNLSVSNAGVIVGDNDMMAIDSLTAPLQTKAFIAAATKATGKKFGRLVNTHHHGDHTFGNQYFAGAEIVGHEYCRKAVIETGVPSPRWQKREGWAEGGEELKLAPPTTTFTDRMTYHYGGMVVELLFLGVAHTWGDVYVYLPQHKVLYAGDVSFHYVTPAAQNGHVTKWLEVCDKILAMDVETIVPGHGPLGGKKEFAEVKEYFVMLKREARKRFDAGMRPGQACADIDLGKFEEWNNPERITWNVVRLYEEFSGTITPAMDRAATDRALEEYKALKAAKSGSQ